MSQYADLEILFRKRDERSYGLSFRYSSPDDEADHPSLIEPVIVLDPADLRLSPDADYAKALSDVFFTQEVKTEFARFRDITQQKAAILRVRLTIDSSAPELHGVRWETLRDPALTPDQENAYLFTGEQTIVSRFLTSGDWRPIRLHPKAQLRALVVIANPGSAAAYQLAPIDVPAGLARVQEALSGISVTVLAPGGAISLNDLAAKLREGFDILYLVCHGKIVNQEPLLYLNEGRPDKGIDLVQTIRELDQRPRMVVLESCQSAGKGEVAFAGLGPRLAEAGVPAVIAMQGNVFMTTAAAFMKRFFTELLVDGQIDRAMSVARGEVRKAPDYWMPVLFMRLRNGRIWYEPGFGGTIQEATKSWKGIDAAVLQKTFIPVLGPELGEEIFRGTQEWADSLARKSGFPLGSHESSDLAKVTQFITVTDSFNEACQAVEVESTLSLRRWLGLEPPGSSSAQDHPMDARAEQALLDARRQLLDQAVVRCQADPDSPYRILSNLPASIYLNASYQTLLSDVLKANGKSPEVIAVPWLGGDVIQAPKPADPAPPTPLVYHVFGHFEDRDTLVLTEDNFFDYLITATRENLLEPVSGPLLANSLLFLGFRLDDWRFRVLFRMILGYGGAALLKGKGKRPHVGVQVNPEEQSVADVKRARDYMESYFGAANSDAPRISIYWGSATDFLKQLRDRTMPGTPALLGGSS
jgi:hypothetical protein